MTTQDVGQTPEQATAQPELGISDLQNLRSIVEVSVRRGTFSAAEITSVGSVYDRLNAFLIAVTPPASTPEADAAAAPTE